ncbi:hypothetical protein GB937_009440 [Aspergillus fischeri]|nr:hypothetical protein GB937_009440 [Aspergillus fischeri]
MVGPGGVGFVDVGLAVVVGLVVVGVDPPATPTQSVQERPSVTSDHLLQSAGEPVMVGPGGVGFEVVGLAVLVVVALPSSPSSPEIPTQ